MELEKNIKIGELYRIYGKLLTKKQSDMMDMYYNFDISISEIATTFCTTRQNVYDMIKKATIQLENIENMLNISNTTNSLRKVFYDNKQNDKDKLLKIKEILEID